MKELDEAMKIMAEFKKNLREEKIPGGHGKKMTKKDVDDKQYQIGMSVEKEHSLDPKYKEEIVLDHLSDNKYYYTDMVEKGLVDEKEAINLYNKLFPDKKIKWVCKNKTN